MLKSQKDIEGSKDPENSCQQNFQLNYKVPKHKSIIKDLKTLSQARGTQFILITKELNSDSEIKISYSSAFKESQTKHIKSILENPNALISTSNICEIKPALKICYELTLSRRSTDALTNHYSDLLTSLSQAICKEVAKQWIKVAEPNKQALYPYKYYNNSKPPWWPSSVNHIEPDHLDKNGRIKVLINILRNPEFSLDSLRARTRVLTFKNLVVHNILDELYYLAAYDRLFFDQLREQNPLFLNLSEEEIKCFSSNVTKIIVSDVRACKVSQKKTGVIMISQIKPYLINDNVYRLNERLDTSSAANEDKFHDINTEEAIGKSKNYFDTEIEDDAVGTEDEDRVVMAGNKAEIELKSEPGDDEYHDLSIEPDDSLTSVSYKIYPGIENISSRTRKRKSHHSISSDNKTENTWKKKNKVVAVSSISTKQTSNFISDNTDITSKKNHLNDSTFRNSIRMSKSKINAYSNGYTNDLLAYSEDDSDSERMLIKAEETSEINDISSEHHPLSPVSSSFIQPYQDKNYSLSPRIDHNNFFNFDDINEDAEFHIDYYPSSSEHSNDLRLDES